MPTVGRWSGLYCRANCRLGTGHTLDVSVNTTVLSNANAVSLRSVLCDDIQTRDQIRPDIEFYIIFHAK